MDYIRNKQIWIVYEINKYDSRGKKETFKKHQN